MAGYRMKMIYEKATKLSSVLGIAVNLGSMVSPNIKMIKDISTYGSSVHSMLQTLTMVMMLCNLMGVKGQKKKKLLVTVTVFMLLGHGIGGLGGFVNAKK
jgi:hypothetical protein